MARFALRFGTLLALALITGCGIKGPLTLPPPSSASPSSNSSPAAPATLPAKP